MTRAAPFGASRQARMTSSVFASSSFNPPPLILARPAPEEAAPARRTRIWEFNANLHCSIIGTCLTTGELRQVLGKTGLAPAGGSDHELHGIAVSLAGQQGQAAKLLHKALDQRHRLAISQFGRVHGEAELRGMWRDCVARGEIPGAYWATLTHPAATRAVVRDAFGEVHMLSHMVGAANRADIRRLNELETQQAELLAKIDRQQEALRAAVVGRDRRIAELQQALVERLHAERPEATPAADGALPATILALEKRLAVEARRRAGLEEQLARARTALDAERAGRVAAERLNTALQAELDAVEPDPERESVAQAADALAGKTLLYVGGRPNQVAHLRRVAAGLGGALLHHDGGREQHAELLPGLVSRADLVLFPVDCISHDAALTIKRLCQNAAKRFLPLRSASSASLLAALAGG